MTFIHSSSIIDYLKTQKSGGNYGVSYIYFEYVERDQQRPIDILRSLVRQLARQMDHLPAALELLYDTHYPKQDNPSFEDVYSAFIEVSSRFRRTFLVFDALDECDQKYQRKGLLPLFHRLKEDGLSLFITSRPYPEDIQLSFENAVKLEILAQVEDIGVYIRQKIEDNPRARRLVRKEGCEEKIISELTDCAKGM